MISIKNFDNSNKKHREYLESKEFREIIDGEFMKAKDFQKHPEDDSFSKNIMKYIEDNKEEVKKLLG